MKLKKESLKNFLTIMNGEYLNIIYYLMNLDIKIIYITFKII